MIKFKNLKEVFEYQASKNSDRNFVLFPQLDKKFTYKEIDKISNKIANYFINKCNLNKGEIIASILDNSPEIVFLYIACFKTGITFMPIDPFFNIDRVKFALKKAKPKVLFLGNKFKDKFNDILTKFDFKIIYDLTDSNNISLESILNKNNNWDIMDIDFDGDMVATLVFTSGTTGEPKGVPLKHKQFINNIPRITNWLKLDSNDNFLCTTPMYYNHGYYNSMLFAMFIGGTITITENFNIFVANEYWDIVIKNNVTILSVVPSIIETLNMLYKKNKINSENLKKVKFAICGTAKLYDFARKEFEKNFNIEVIRQYGLIETLLITFDKVNDKNKKENSTGKPVAGEILIEDETGNKVGINKNGEIVIRADSIIDSYFKNSELTKEKIKGNKFYTGDIGYLDEDKNLYILARKDDIINKGGNKISPYEIEKELLNNELVKDAAVIGVPDDLYGENILCFIVKKENIDNEKFICNIKQFCSNKLPQNFIPSRFEILDSIPKGPTGKILRNKLKSLFKKRM